MSVPDRGHGGDSRGRGYEVRDLSNRVLVIGLIVLAALTLVSVLAMGGLFGLLESRAAASRGEPSPLVETDVRPPGPILETEPGQVLARLRAEESARLGSYVWMDPAAGVARIPIDRAMEILASRGLPDRVSGETEAESGR